MDIFSNLMAIGECLLDQRRTNTFKVAIEETVKPGDIVIDIGTGSGVLAMFAAKTGAKKVFAIEIAPDVSKFAKQNITANGLEKKIKVINLDVKDLNFLPRADVIIMELMDTWLVAEHQATAFNTLHQKKIITSNTRLVPYRYLCALELVQYNFNFSELYMPFIIQARNFAAVKHIQKKMSKTKFFKAIDFGKTINLQVREVVKISILSSGIVNAVVLRAKIYLSKKRSLWGTTDLNMPVIVPLDPLKVTKGDWLYIKISYVMGLGFDKFSAKVLKVAKI